LKTFFEEGGAMEISYTAIGERIRRFRKALRITQAELGERAQVEPSNISHIERGATKVSLPTLIRIANTLHVSLDDLVYDSIENSCHISNKEISNLLSDCTDDELKAIVEMTKATKNILRNGS
jgi:transcriptional regulator with XRE-family HTH domain